MTPVRALRRRALLAALAALPLGAAPLAAQRLFRSTDPVDVTITTDLKALIKERDSTKVAEHAAVLRYTEPDGKVVDVKALVSARGHFRRQARNCDFPPVLVDFKKPDIEGTLFQGNGKLKLTTNCRPRTAEYEQYILSEYAVYRVYQRISPAYFRTRLARVTYKDANGASPDVTSWAFFTENDTDVAKEFNAKLDKAQGAYWEDLEPEQTAITALFEYMIGNTDWSIGGQHNVRLLRDSSAILAKLVAYDFDWSGAVNPRYAFPDARLGIKKVTDRLYRGPCLTVEQWAPVVARFVEARPAIDSIYASIEPMDPKRRETALAWYKSFYDDVKDARAIRRALIEGCLSDAV